MHLRDPIVFPTVLVSPWFSWGPTQQKLACVRGLLARCFYFASTRDMFQHSLAEAFGLLIWQASFPKNFVIQAAKRWAKEWQPKELDSSDYPFALQVDDIHHALTFFDTAESLL